MDFMIPYGVLLYQSSAKSLRCLPMKSNFLLEIPPESGSARLGLAWETAIAPETLYLITTISF